MTGATPALRVRGLRVRYPDGTRALRGVDLELPDGGCLALVGESGCGKSTLVAAVLGLLPRRTVTHGLVEVAGRRADGGTPRDRRRLRAELVGYVPQNPFTAVNPLLGVQYQVRAAARVHGVRVGPAQVSARLRELGIDATAADRRSYPHQWSGGMLQRALIAAATWHDPALLLADEPTSALDEEIAEPMMSVLRSSGRSLLLVTHDLALAAKVADAVAVMYAGRVVEHGPVAAVLDRPRHPYTAALLAAAERVPGRLPEGLPGDPPDLRLLADGPCAFAPRCRSAADRCTDEPPSGPVACHYPG